MKKTLSVILLVLALTALLSVSAAPEFYLNGPITINRFANLSSNITATDSTEEFTFSPTSNDPIVNISLSEKEQFKAEDFPFVALKMSVKSALTTGGFFFGTSQFPGPQGDDYSQFDIVNDGTMTDYIVDMTSFKHGRWKGTVNKFRVDPINPSGNGSGSTEPDLEAVITIERIGFFATREDAEAFLKKDAASNKITETPTAEPVKWDFVENPDLIDTWFTSGGLGAKEFGFFKVESTTTDVHIDKELGNDEKIDADNLKYFAYRYNAKNTTGTAGFFFTNQNHTKITDATFTPFSITGDGTWRNVIYDISTASHQNWKGTIDSFRLDVSNPSKVDSVIYIAKMGFFSTYTEALEFLKASNKDFDYSTETTISDTMYRTHIPANTLSADYDENEYILQNPLKAEHVDKPYVVSYTDNSGNESIVALSDISSLGFVNYVARKPGTYKLVTNHKDYSDINGHWGSDYINYVSDRKLFGGTSETEFSPDMTMTRGMFITVLGRMHGVDTANYGTDTGYSDVNSAEYYAPYISWAKENALMAPISDTAFAPEEPIFRKDMALVIYNYIKAFNYSFKNVAFEINFTDLASCSAEQAEAIKYIQSCGIINGIGGNKFDPDGSSTRAEVSAVMQRVIKSVLGTYQYSQYDNDYFKRDRIRIGTWANFSYAYFNDEYMKTYYEGGFDWFLAFGSLAAPQNSKDVLDYAAKYGIEVYLRDGAVESSDPLGVMAEYYDHPAFTGSVLTDEPGSDAYDKLAAQSKNYTQATNGEKLPYTNLLPMYANAAQLKYGANAAQIAYYDSDPDLYKKYCQAFVDKFDVDYICTDIYPMNNTIYSKYIESINIIATVARESGKTFWCYYHGSYSTDIPTKEFSWQIYSLLSFGCKGYLYWIWEPWAMDKGETTANYDAVKPVMLELRAISDVYVQYKNLGAFNFNYHQAYAYMNMTNQYKDFDTIAEIKSEDPLLFGCFDKIEGNGKAFTIVNMYNPRSSKSAEAKLRINGTTVTSYFGGTPTVLTPDADGYYTISLNNGEGAFITVD